MITRDDVDRFPAFAISRIENGGVASMKECARQWQDELEYQASLEALRESLDDAKAGRTRPVDEAIADIRQKLGLN